MSWMVGPNGAYALVSQDQWQQLADTLDQGDLDRARELLTDWRPWTWPDCGELAGERA